MYIREKYYCDRCLLEIDPEDACPHCGFRVDENEEKPSYLPGNTRLQNRYVIGSVIGAGSFGITYSGWDTALNKPIAIKEFFPRNSVSRDTQESFSVNPLGTEENRLVYYRGVEWFQREARILAALKDTANIVHVEDYFKANGTAYIVMDFLRGKTLAAAAKEQGGCLPGKEVLSLMKQPIEALGKVHQFGLLHRDISPKNVMLLESGETYLIDFGSATALEPDSDLTATMLFVNHSFSPPEQHTAVNQGPWTDVYAVCATILYLILGHDLPTAAEREQKDTLPQLVKETALPRRIQKVLLQGMNLKVKDRIQSISLLLHGLYGIPLPKSELEKQRLKKRIRQIVAAFVVLYISTALIWGLSIDALMKDTRKVLISQDAAEAMRLAEKHALGIYIGDTAAADYWYRWAADHGTDAQILQIAEMYSGQNRDAIAVEYVQKAAQLGNPEALNWLGTLYWKGETVPGDLQKAEAFLQAAAEAGNTDALVNLGLIAAQEHGDMHSCFELVLRAAMAGNENGMYYTACAYDTGNGIDQDPDQAMEWLLKAAQGRQPDAMALIGCYYLENDIALGNGHSWRDYQTGLDWIQSALWKESPIARFLWARIMAGEIPIPEEILKANAIPLDDESAFYQMRKAAEAGYLPAMLEVAEMYEHGIGTQTDPAEAQRWKLASQQ